MSLVRCCDRCTSPIFYWLQIATRLQCDGFTAPLYHQTREYLHTYCTACLQLQYVSSTKMYTHIRVLSAVIVTSYFVESSTIMKRILYRAVSQFLMKRILYRTVPKFNRTVSWFLDKVLQQYSTVPKFNRTVSCYR